MQDHPLYQQISGIVAPWRVEDVELRLQEGEVHVYLGHEPRASWTCPECQAEPHSRFTALFERLAIDWLKAATQKAVADQLGLSWDEVHGIMERAVKRGLARRKREMIGYLGVDEKAFRKGHKHLGEAVDKVRRSEHKELSAKGDERLKGTKDDWLKGRDRFDLGAGREFCQLRRGIVGPHTVA